MTSAPHAAQKPPAKSKPVRRVTTPTVLQMEAVECGAAALAMVLAHHGRVVPLEELRVDCGISRDGSKASNVLRAARAHGLVAKGFRKEPAALRQIAPPMILHWNFNHFVVLDGFDKRGVHLNDPASGPITISEPELDQAFTGVVLTFERGEAFEPGGEPPSFIAALRRRLVGASPALAFVVLAGLLLIAPGLLASTFTQIFVDEVIIRDLTSWVRPLMLAMIATSLLVFGLTALQQHYLLRLESRLSLHGSGRFFWHVLRLPIRFFTQRYAGDIANRVAINDEVSALLSGDLATTAVSLLVVGLYGALLFQYDVLLSLVGMATASLNLLALRYVSQTRIHLTQRLTQDRGKMMGTAMSALQTIDTLKATGSESDFFARWSGQQTKVVIAQQQLQLTTLLLSAVPSLLMAVNTALILGLGGARVMDGHLTIGMLIGFQALLGSFLGPVNRMVDLGGTLQQVKGNMARLDDVLRAKIDVELGPSSESAPIAPSDNTKPAPAKLSGWLELRNVSFGYSPLEPPLIEDFNLSLKPGSRVALVGGSGSGKSTVARLVAGLQEPWSGEVLFDGKPRHELPRETLIQSLALVDQDICLFEGSVRANLTLWDASVAEADLISAARDACLHDEIISRGAGYASLVEEGGRNFSGGQRQRMEIARALATDPSVLVLDEATSALDPTTEKRVDDHIRCRGCTCLIVAHRLSTIRDCDEILVLDKGKVVQRGTHHQLIKVPGPYRALISAEAA
jgi:NHLM bacteriocin system ABC transporter peptidase/ATP-binding protein